MVRGIDPCRTITQSSRTGRVQTDVVAGDHGPVSGNPTDSHQTGPKRCRNLNSHPAVTADHIAFVDVERVITAIRSNSSVLSAVANRDSRIAGNREHSGNVCANVVSCYDRTTCARSLDQRLPEISRENVPFKAVADTISICADLGVVWPAYNRESSSVIPDCCIARRVHTHQVPGNDVVIGSFVSKPDAVGIIPGDHIPFKLITRSISIGSNDITVSTSDDDHSNVAIPQVLAAGYTCSDVIPLNLVPAG